MREGEGRRRKRIGGKEDREEKGEREREACSDFGDPETLINNQDGKETRPVWPSLHLEDHLREAP
jgi:hypothetical protein